MNNVHLPPGTYRRTHLDPQLIYLLLRLKQQENSSKWKWQQTFYDDNRLRRFARTDVHAMLGVAACVYPCRGRTNKGQARPTSLTKARAAHGPLFTWNILFTSLVKRADSLPCCLCDPSMSRRHLDRQTQRGMFSHGLFSSGWHYGDVRWAAQLKRLRLRDSWNVWHGFKTRMRIWSLRTMVLNYRRTHKYDVVDGSMKTWQTVKDYSR